MILVSTDIKGNQHSSIFSAIDTIGLGNFLSKWTSELKVRMTEKRRGFRRALFCAYFTSGSHRYIRTLA